MAEPPGTASPPLRYRYRISFPDRSTRSVDVRIDRDSLSLIAEPRSVYPEWTRLGFRGCPNCPLDPSRHERCPVAGNLVDLLEFFKDRLSYEEVDVVVDSENRSYSKHTSLQAALSSLLGLYMPTSGCPILGRLRPMVVMHLPFQTRHETAIRMISTYLVTQYLLHRRGRQPDWELADLLGQLEAIRTVNSAFCRRINAATSKDASANALVILSTLGNLPTGPLTRNEMTRIERIVRTHYGGLAGP